MNISSKTLSIAVIGLIIINLAILAFMFFGRPKGGPNGMHGPMHPNGKGPVESFIAELNFDDEQTKSFMALRDEHRATMKSLMDKNRDFRNEFFNQLTVTSDLINSSLADSIAANQKKIELITLDHFMKVGKLCKPEQKSKFNLLIVDVVKSMGPQHPRPH